MYITENMINLLSFRLFRKTVLLRARLLTQEDYDYRGGVIYTLEGPVTFQPGDYLAVGLQDQEWPITPRAFTILYDEQVAGPDAEGFVFYRSACLRQAVQITEPFTLKRKGGDIFMGKAGDYLVRSVEGEETWIVDRTIFEQTYESVLESE